MPRRMVDAFKKEIEEDKEPSKGSEEFIKKTLTMNPRRQEILQYLCRYPCSRLSKIARDLDISNAATKWHLISLADSDFITLQKVKGETVYYPTNMVDKKDIGIFSAMNHERATPILRRIIANSGISQKNLKDEVQLNQRTVVRHTTELENAGLIEITAGENKSVLELSTQPFASIMERYKGL
jgi:predicted transcriptional regulator